MYAGAFRAAKRTLSAFFYLCAEHEATSQTKPLRLTPQTARLRVNTQNVYDMERIEIRVLKEAKEFLDKIPLNAYRKMSYILDRVAGGEKNAEIFKKLENSEIWEFRIESQGMAYRLFSFWDTKRPQTMNFRPNARLFSQTA